MLRWRIYYDDGSTFSCSEGTPEDAPWYGVVCVVQTHPDSGRQIVKQFDAYYFLDPPEAGEYWWGSNEVGALVQFARHPQNRRALKLGGNVSAAAYEDICTRAMLDPDFPPASRPDFRTVIEPYRSDKGR